MKGGLVVALAALTALKEAKALDGMHITVVMTGDEEDSGRPLSLARASLVEAAKAADVAIGLENGADDPKTALTARRGYTGWQIDVKARSAHSSQIFTDEVGAGAIYELARILHTFLRRAARRRAADVQPGPDRRQHAAQLRSEEAARGDLRQGQHRRAGWPLRPATCARSRHEQLERTKERMQQDRRGEPAAHFGDDHVHATAIRRCRRPTATASCWRCTTRSVAISASAR